MAQGTPASSECKANVRATTPVEKEHSLPTPAASGRQGSSRPRQLPTVTPRRFRRFFTPRSSSQYNVKVGTSRQALRDITTGGSNQQNFSRLRSIKSDAIQIFQDENKLTQQSSRKRKRAVPNTPASTPELSSPLKRFQSPSVEDPDLASDIESGPLSVSSATDDVCRRVYMARVPPIARWRQERLPGQRLQQELGGLARTSNRVYLGSGNGKSAISGTR